MGVNTDYLGHVEIVPNLNQAEYDYLHAFARSRRSDRPRGPYAVSPEDPDTGNGEREVELCDPRRARGGRRSSCAFEVAHRTARGVTSAARRVDLA
jgi:hypothetical protein